MMMILKHHGLLSEIMSETAPEYLTEELSLAIHKFLSQTDSRIILISLHDLFGELKQPNMPGTVDEYPNWAMRHSITTEELEKSERYSKLLNVFKSRGKTVDS